MKIGSLSSSILPSGWKKKSLAAFAKATSSGVMSSNPFRKRK